MRSIGIILGCFLFVGCQSIAPLIAPQRMSGETMEPQPPSYLNQAAECIEKGDNAQAAELMKKHIQENPDQIMIRAYHAELLLKLNRSADAQWQYERFISQAQATDGPAKNHLIHSHTRLMEIAQERKDRYNESLHRGIGLYLLAKQQGAKELAEPGFKEQLLCKAAMALKEAQEIFPTESRPVWYLYEVWNQLDQTYPAQKALHQAYAHRLTSRLTPTEEGKIQMAWMQSRPMR